MRQTKSEFSSAHSKTDLLNDLEERLKFESLLAEVSASFINLPSEQIDGAIEDAQRRICQLLGLDISALWQMSVEREGNIFLTHVYRRLEDPPIPEPMNAQEYFPWSLQQIISGKIINFSTEEVPPEAARDLESYRHYRIKSSLVFGLSVGGQEPFGVLSFHTVEAARTWPELLVNRLQLVAQVFANSLARKYTDLALRESEARLSLTTSAAGAGLWAMDLATGHVWVNPKTRELFHFPPDEALNYEYFLRAIYPDDRERVDHAVKQALQSGKLLKVDYRIILPDGSIRWIAARGQGYPGSTGEPDRLMGVSIDISGRKQIETELHERLKEIEELKGRLESENLYLRKDLKMEQGFEKILGISKPFNAVIFAAKQVATTDATVLLLGETGTGKGLMANAIHRLSTRKDRPLVTVNCSALPKNLIESELFGREKGAFTGANVKQPGRFEVADGGTIFLDEIGEMPLDLQSKLLRVLQEGEFERLGSAKTLKVNVRVIAATSRDLKLEVRKRRFREDLFYRLNVFPISIPPLRQRTEDIPQLVQYFTEKYACKMGKRIENIPTATMKIFQEYDWPGNVRELEHVIERGVIITSGHSLKIAEMLKTAVPINSKEEPLKDLAATEREHILKVLRETDWRIEGQFGAASILKLHPSTLRFRIKKLGIRRPT